MDSANLKFDGSELFNSKNSKTKIKDLYKSTEDYENQLLVLQNNLDELQSKMYAQNKYGMLVIFQAMDAAGKDGTIKAVFQNINPMGLRFYSFKRPSETELNHDYLWRCFKELPERGTIQVFNRSYYEEVLVVKVHPEILTNYQKLPAEKLKDLDALWENRYKDIQNFEEYLNNNGIVLVKFFLNVSKKEQAERLIERIEDPSKNWKFEEGDVKERGFWNQYMTAFEDLINKTGTSKNPWYVIPADDKKNMRLLVAQTLFDELSRLNISYPESNPERKATLETLIETIKQQNKE
jgi:PPK2 family polyphosphate:nucleotide phosphotransferase